jgi:hypothetical protein
MWHKACPGDLCGLRRRSALALLLGSPFRIPSVVFVVDGTGSGLCNELISRSEEAYLVCVYDTETSNNEAA